MVLRLRTLGFEFLYDEKITTQSLRFGMMVRVWMKRRFLFTFKDEVNQAKPIDKLSVFHRQIILFVPMVESSFIEKAILVAQVLRFVWGLYEFKTKNSYLR